MKISWPFLGLVLVVSCGGSKQPLEAGVAAQPLVCGSSANEDVQLRLSATCKGCHGEGANHPFFASLAAFEQSLVYNAKLVVPGKPGESYLVRLLEGTSSSVYKQMPLNGDSFATLDHNGKTKISLNEIKSWISALPPAPASLAKADIDAVTTRRLTAEEIIQSLYDQLGLSNASFMYVDYGALWENKVPLVSPDFPFASGDSYGAATQRYMALGGANTLSYQNRERAVTPALIQVLNQISQAWCGLSLENPATPLLRDATLADTSMKSSSAIKKNIAYLELRMLGEAVPGEVDSIYDNVFLKYEPQGSKTAWVAVCASLIRHPRWMSF